jgi:ABC-type glycerol-3-phosphate transport system permease component
MRQGLGRRNISGVMTSEGLFWAKMSAASTVAIAPVFIAGWAAQRALVHGLTMGAVKKGPSVVSGGGL